MNKLVPVISLLRAM